MSRFAANPKWLIYLPPTMSRSETNRRAGYLEYPEEAFAYFRYQVLRMLSASRSIWVRVPSLLSVGMKRVPVKNLGAIGEGIGIYYTRTGRRFFSDASLEQALLVRVHGCDAEQACAVPFLASAGRVYTDVDHIWHMEMLSKLAAVGPALLVGTAFQWVDLANETSVADATGWWEKLTESGGEGMVVKPLNYVARGRRDLAQPAMKCRGREYLRIIYGPEYTREENLVRLRARGLVTKFVSPSGIRARHRGVGTIRSGRSTMASS